MSAPGKNAIRAFRETGAPVAYSLTFHKLSPEAAAALVEKRYHVIRVCLPKPEVREGVTFPWVVEAIRITPEGKVLRLREQFLARSEEEAMNYADQLEAELQKEENERPIPGQTFKARIFVTGKTVKLTGTPLSLVGEKGNAEKASRLDEELLPDVPCVAVCDSFWRGADGSGQAMKSVVTEYVEFHQGFRILRFAEPLVVGETKYPFAVEYAEFDLNGVPLRVIDRWPCCDEPAAIKLLGEKEKEIPALTAKLTGEPGPSAEDVRDEARIREIEAMARRSLDSAAKARHQQLSEEIRSEMRERRRIANEAVAAKAEKQREEHAAFTRLLDETFPEVAKASAKVKAAAPAEEAAAREALRRAMKVDCTRLGIRSPFNLFAVDSGFAVEVAKAVKAKSPFKAAQVEAVLNWMAKGYETMPEKEWAAAVGEKIKAPVKPGGLGKTISKKFGLKSKLKGRPETESGKNGEG